MSRLRTDHFRRRHGRAPVAGDEVPKSRGPETVGLKANRHSALADVAGVAKLLQRNPSGNRLTEACLVACPDTAFITDDYIVVRWALEATGPAHPLVPEELTKPRRHLSHIKGNLLSSA